MVKKCENCGALYDDEFRLTYCPHNSLDGRCIVHDLYGCPFHGAAKNDEETASNNVR